MASSRDSPPKGSDDAPNGPEALQPANKSAAPIAPAAVARVHRCRYAAMVCKMLLPVSATVFDYSGLICVVWCIQSWTDVSRGGSSGPSELSHDFDSFFCCTSWRGV